MGTFDVRPRLVVLYHRQSLPPLEIADAAASRYELIWVCDHADPELTMALQIIRRLGATIDTAGRSDDEVAALVARERPDGVITFADQMPLAAAIAAASGLRFHSPRTADLLTNKYRQRLALAEHGVPGPAFWELPADAEARSRLARTLNYPVVLKPQDGLGSRHTYDVPDAAALLRILDEGDCRGEEMLVEERLAEAHPREQQRLGETLMVDSFISGGTVMHLVVTGHFIPATPFRGTGSFLPSHLDGPTTEAVLAQTSAALAALGIVDGFTNTDLILTPAGPRVLEVNGRIGGQVPTLFQMAGACPLISEAMKFAVGAPDLDVFALATDRVAFCAMYQPPPEATRLLALGGLDVITALPGVTRIEANRQVGDALDWREGTASRLFTVYGVASDHEALIALDRRIRDAAVLRYAIAEQPDGAVRVAAGS